MPEVDPGLEIGLRSFLNEIKAQPVPRPLADFEPAGVRPRRKALNLFAGAAGVAVIAAGVAVFAVELNGHHGAGSPLGGLSAGANTPGTAALGLPSISRGDGSRTVLIPKTYGSGSETLPSVTLAPNEGLGVEYTCVSTQPRATAICTVVGKGVPGIVSRGGGSGPTSVSSAYETAAGAGGPITLHLSADPSVKWVILVYEFRPPAPLMPKPTAPITTPSSFPGPTPPFLREGPAPTGATVLIPVTYGTGSMTLPSFTATPNQNVSIELGCLSTSPSVTTVTVNFYDPAFTGDTLVGQCFGGDGGSGGGGSNGFVGTVTMKVQAAPTEKWVILVYAGGGP